jgi:hypothetical protein
MGTLRHDGQVTNGLQTFQQALPATDAAWHGTQGMKAADPHQPYPVPAGEPHATEHL